MQNLYQNVISISGKPVQGASVLVTLASDNSTATIYSDNGVTTTPNPLTTDAFGRFNFYAANGRYNFSVSANGVVGYSFSDVIIADVMSVLSYTDTGILGSWSSATAGYNQLVIQNSSNTVSASANYVAANSATTSTTNFAEFGINSPTFSGSGPFSVANAGYVTATTGDLSVGTTTAHTLRLGTNSVERASIDSLGNFVANVNTAAPSLTVNGQMTFALTTNTNLRISVRGSDGVTRSTNLTLA